MKIAYLVLDIETVPSRVITYEEVLNLVPKSIKKQETIENWINENYDIVNGKQALSPFTGTIISICAKIVNSDISFGKVCTIEEEKELLEDFIKFIKTNIDFSASTVYFVGHNIRDFDIPFIKTKMLYHKLEGIRYLPTEYYSKNILDTMELIACGKRNTYISLDTACNFLSIPRKEGMLGSEVYDYYKRGEYNKILSYCKNDVIITEGLFKRITYDNPTIAFNTNNDKFIPKAE